VGLSRIEYHAEQVYYTPAHNALASRMIVDQLTPLLRKDSEEVNAPVNRQQAMLDSATMEAGHGVRTLIGTRNHVGTRPAVSLR
jgi:hypothetical protein